MANFGSFHQQRSSHRRSWAWIGWMVLLVGLVVGLHFRWGLLPPFARLLSPFEGAWQTTLQPYQAPGTYTIQGKSGPIQIELDADLVPHIAASSQEDVFMGQGFITAQHRLWQMDFQNLAAAGRLSEIIGEKAIEFDRFQRRFGMKEAARRSGKEMLQNPETQSILYGYAEGINLAIRHWPTRQLPLEFKILDYEPEEWKPENTGLLLKRMAFTLSAGNDDKAMNLILEKFGKSVTDQLFPDRLPVEEPIIPAGTQWNFEPLKVPEVPLSLGWTDTTDDAIPQKGPKLKDDDQVELGSNNWAVMGRKTKSGHPILANDPHLSMKLPSTWYIAELKAPGYHCMGASIPGAPGIISGFNENLSWGVTNGYPDVCDWFRIVYKDKAKRFYWFNGAWHPTQMVIETVHIRGKASIQDTIYWTHLGPVVYNKGQKPFQSNVPENYALRWVAHDPSNEMLAFIRINKSNRVADMPAALQTYQCPAQNFVAADREGHIGMFSQQGKIPLRWKDQGKFLLQAGSADQNWQGYLPYNHLPRVVDPPQGYLSSANQNPTDTTYPYYLNWDFGSLERAQRINEILGQDSAFDMQKMLRLQNDNQNLWARKVLPEMLRVVSAVANRSKWATDVLAAWKYNMDPAETGATLFETWFAQWMELAWADNFKAEMRYPDKHVAWQIYLEKNNSDWFDYASTKEIELGSELILRALHQAMDTLNKKLGPYTGNENAYRWGNYKATTIEHLAKMGGLGTDVLQIGGGKGIVNATSTTTGQSWKMIVEMGPKPKAMAIYPGGQSGNPSSPFYGSFIETWRSGNMKNLHFKL